MWCVGMQARKLPQTHAETVEFFLETESEEMEFETARCRPMLTEDFFGYLQQQISTPHIPVVEKHRCTFEIFKCSETKCTM